MLRAKKGGVGLFDGKPAPLIDYPVGAACPEFRIRAAGAIRRVARRGFPFVEDDVWAELGVPARAGWLRPVLAILERAGRVRRSGDGWEWCA